MLLIPTNAEPSRAKALSLTARPGTTGVAGMRVALLVTEGTDAEKAHAVYRALTNRKAAPRMVANTLGVLQLKASEPIYVEVSIAHLRWPLNPSTRRGKGSDTDGHAAVFVGASCRVVRDPQTVPPFQGRKTNEGRALNITATVAMAIAPRAKS